jgi:hypothetical protein
MTVRIKAPVDPAAGDAKPIKAMGASACGTAWRWRKSCAVPAAVPDQAIAADRQAHNLKVVGSNPTPATNFSKYNQMVRPLWRPFHFLQAFSNYYQKNARISNELQPIRRGWQSAGKNSAAQNWHKAAQKTDYLLVVSQRKSLRNDTRGAPALAFQMQGARSRLATTRLLVGLSMMVLRASGPGDGAN